jgi:hypothetical protein
MLVLFDQGTPIGIRHSLRHHTVKTALEQGWSTLENGALLREAEKAGFDVLLTTDNNMVYQQNLSQRKIAVVSIGRNRWSLIRPFLDRIVKAVDAAKPGTHVIVDIPGR